MIGTKPFEAENRIARAVELLRLQGYVSELDIGPDERMWGNSFAMARRLAAFGWQGTVWARETVCSADLRVWSFYDPRQLSADLVDELVRDDADLAGR
jgi:hypothetical protein